MRKFYLLVPAFLLFSLHLYSQSSTRLYVDSSRALAAANSNSAIQQIWVRKGTHYPDEGTGRTNNDRNSSLAAKTDWLFTVALPAGIPP